MSTAAPPRARPRPATPPIDPRLRDRRIEVARVNGRRRLRRVLVVVAVLAVVAGAVVLARSPVLDVDQIQVRGTGASGAAAVRRASGISPGEPMISLNTGRAAGGVEALPTVSSATVSRAWPGTVRITVVERQPIAVLGRGAQAVVIDRSGRAIAKRRPGVPPHLARLSGDPIAIGQRIPTARIPVVAVLADLPSALARQVASARVAPTGVVLELEDGIEVRWGDTAQATAKAEALQVLLEQADRSTIEAIDVSVPRASTLRRKNGGQ